MFLIYHAIYLVSTVQEVGLCKRMRKGINAEKLVKLVKVKNFQNFRTIILFEIGLVHSIEEYQSALFKNETFLKID